MAKRLNIFEFIGAENQNQLITIANLKDNFGYFTELDGIYHDLNDLISVNPNSDLQYIVATLYLQSHNELYIGMSQFFSSHLGKAFLSLRIAIETAFNAYYFTKNPKNVREFFEKDSKVQRNVLWSIKRYIKMNKAEYPLAQNLVIAHETASNIAAHASFAGLIYKHDHMKDKEENKLGLNYFDNIADQHLGYYFCLLNFFLRVYNLFYEAYYKNEFKVIYPPRDERVKKFEKALLAKYTENRLKTE